MKVLVLAYHSINDKRKDGLAVQTTEFERQIDYLVSKGYKSITLSQFGEIKKSGNSLPAKTVIITFDDGYRDNFTNAYPVLKRYGYTATIFLTVNFIGTQQMLFPELFIHKYGGAFEDYQMLMWEEIREMLDNGIEFGSHTLTHPNLPRISLKQAEKEIALSKEIMEKMLGRTIESFCYPFGHFDNHILLIVSNYYKYAVVTPNIYNPIFRRTLYTIRRISIYRGDNFQRFRLKISRPFFMIQPLAVKLKSLKNFKNN